MTDDNKSLKIFIRLLKCITNDEDAEHLYNFFYYKINNDINENKIELSPSEDNIFEFARLTPIKKIHTVIIDQDPYLNSNHAHGLAFSSKDSKVPKSLKNIYKCLLNFKLINKVPKKSDLSIWSKRGVLLINTSLTTSVGNSNSHQEIWKKYFNIISQERFEKAQEKAFEELDYEECTEDRCIMLIQEMLQV